MLEKSFIYHSEDVDILTQFNVEIELRTMCVVIMMCIPMTRIVLTGKKE